MASPSKKQKVQDKRCIAVFRGPAGSGKSTVANAIVKLLSSDHNIPTAYLEQDYFRNSILQGKNGVVSSADVSASMLLASAEASVRGGYSVVLEGILNCNQDGRGKYRPVLEGLEALAAELNINIKIFYLDVPIEVTKERHLGRSKASAFGTEKLDKWWASSQPSGLTGEVLINSRGQNIDDTVSIVLEHLIPSSNSNSTSISSSTKTDDSEK
jgi:predicted kinase